MAEFGDEIHDFESCRNRRLFMLNIFFDATAKGSFKKSFEY
jgi:hypothetical protein